MRIPLTDAAATALTNGTRLLYEYRNDIFVGILERTVNNNYFKLIDTSNKKIWAICRWELYSVMSDEDYVLWKLEQ